jgi:putative BNR repeat neuraminidase
VRKNLVICLAVSALLGGAQAAGASTISVAGGGWCWFGDPRAIAIGDDVYVGWITSEGNVEVGRIALRTGAMSQAQLHSTLPSDDHSNPSLTTMPDGRLLVFYSPHSGRLQRNTHLWYRVSVQPGGVNAWSGEHSVPVNSPGSLGFTYPNPVWVGPRLYLFWRGGNWEPTFSVTTDLKKWSRARTLLRGPRGQRPYVKYDVWGNSIRFAYTGAHPGSRATSLYFGQLKDWAVRRANGTRIASSSRVPFDYRRGERIYSWKSDGRAWVWDIAHDWAGHPVIVYATYKNSALHSYRYARWTGSHWLDRKLIDAGPHIDQDPSYSAGLTIDHWNANVLYLSVMVNGHYEIERWQTSDLGKTWVRTPITTDSTRDNLRPVVPRGIPGSRALLWTWGNYRAYKDYSDLVIMLRAPLTPPALQRWGQRRTPPPSAVSQPAG